MGVIELAKLYTDKNKKRRAKNIKKFNEDLIKFALSHVKEKQNVK